jgi:hypothetical protein
MEHFGEEIEHGVRLISVKIGHFQKAFHTSSARDSLIASIDKVLTNKNRSWFDINTELEESVIGYQKEIATQLKETQYLLEVTEKLENLFEEHNEKLKSAILTFPSLADNLREKQKELAEFRSPLGNSKTLISSDQQVLSQNRQMIMQFLKNMSYRLVTSPWVTVSILDLDGLMKLKEALKMQGSST